MGTLQAATRTGLLRQMVAVWPELRTGQGDVVQALLWQNGGGEWVGTHAARLACDQHPAARRKTQFTGALA